MKRSFLIATLLIGFISNAQVGIGNTDPKSSLDISASNTSTPANTDGILIPRVDEFPISDPGADQDGMLVFVTGNGTPSKGFYYWNNTTTSWTPVNSGTDADWFVQGTTSSATSINDNIYRLGRMQIGINNPSETSSVFVGSTIGTNYTGLRLSQTGSDNSTIGYGLMNQSTIDDAIRFSNVYNINSGSHDAVHYAIENLFQNTGSGTKYGLYNDFDTSGTGGAKIGVSNRFEGGSSFVTGLENSFPGAFNVVSNISGVVNTIGSTGNGIHYGISNSLTGSGSGTKYGSYNFIDSNAGGAHYGVYSDVQKLSGSYAGYFRGRVSLGHSGADRYFMPGSDGTMGQVLKTDGAGQLTFADPIDTRNSLDSAYDEGGPGAGRMITADVGSIEFVGTGGTTTTQILTHNNAGNGLQINTNGNLTASGQVSQGVEINNDVNTLASFTRNYGIFNKMTVNGNATNGLNYGMRTWFLPAGSAEGTLYGFHHESQNSGNSTQYGFYNRIDNSGTGDKYGFYSNITSTTGGIHYGVYSQVQSSSGYAGYFLGRMNLGDTGVNRYFLPGSDGTAGQVITTDGAGQLSFVNPTDTDNQIIDQLGISGSSLGISLEDDGQPVQTVDLSSVNFNVSNFALAKMTMSLNQSLPANSFTKLNFDSALIDLGSNYNTTTDSFEVSETGYYRITASFNSVGINSTFDIFDLYIVVDGTVIKSDYRNHHGNGYVVRFVETVAQASAGEAIEVYCFSQSAITINSFSRYTTFEVERIR